MEPTERPPDAPARRTDSDIPSDPTPGVSRRGSARGKDDLDTCRICRGEGSPDEPLFYPCKCSGSIKFVHQDCLMEWLSHSQKKYCELCKTPFHFTKLYSPNMPSRLPTSVFLRRALLHLIGHLWTWTRGLIVGAIWLVCLPWVMRYAWRVMFWIGDAGWARDTKYMLPLLSASPEEVAATLQAFAQPDANAPVHSNSLAIPSVLNITSQTLNMTHQPIVFKLIRGLVWTISAPLRRSDPRSGLTSNLTADPMILEMLEQSRSSILSDVDLLKDLTPSQAFNRFVMDVLEGQIITLSVVVTCILVFLIREWVVQQQPVVDLGAADADNALAQAGGGVNNEQEQPAALGAENDEEVAEVATTTNVDDSVLRSVWVNATQLRRMRLDLLDLDLDSTVPGDGQTTLEVDARHTAIDRLEAETLSLIREHRITIEMLRHAKEHDGTFAELDDRAIETLELLFQILGGPQQNADEASFPDDRSRQRASSPRPSMPPRSRSSIAMDIARDIEERSLDDRILASEARDSQTDEDGHESNGSWLNLPDAERRQALDSPEISASALLDGQLDGSTPLEAVGSAAHGREANRETRDDASWVSTVDEARGSDIESTLAVDVDGEPRQAVGAIPRQQTIAPEPERARSLTEKVADWFWGDIAPNAPLAVGLEEALLDADDEHRLADIADEPPFVRFEDGQPVAAFNEPAVPPELPEHREPDEADATPPEQEHGDDEEEVAVAAEGEEAPPGDGPEAQQFRDLLEAEQVDAEAIEDAEDLEGILELIGMQGPLVGLIQNAIFSSILISMSIVVCVFIPYKWGKLVLLHMAEPRLLYTMPLRIATVIADLTIDTVISISGLLFMTAHKILTWALATLPFSIASKRSEQVATEVTRITASTLERLFSRLGSANRVEVHDVLWFSMACHTALHVVEDRILGSLESIFGHIQALIFGLASGSVSEVKETLLEVIAGLIAFLKPIIITMVTGIKSVYTTGSIPVAMNFPLQVPHDPMLTYWNARDRALAILAGYMAIAFVCALYVKVAPITTSARSRHIESYMVDACLQAGGVLKVILIISIEMIAFPLFCGFLLDFALLPLFDGASFDSRVAFTRSRPWTSGFVHWFVGTCYMFHFALFVSMCRRILRTGVLYFIRDPDDPTFHPVRDVLERNVVTQLRKIAFSAIVYGALIIMCLGGVVWGMWMASTNVLPIHWSSTGSNIEFPLDILFYNFLTPFVVHYAKPSAGITIMYRWWFETVARFLRLSDFLFANGKLDEEGCWTRKTWRAWLRRQTNVDGLNTFDHMQAALGRGRFSERNVAYEDDSVRFVFDGRYVRAPNSDQVRLTKGVPIFIPVDADNNILNEQLADEKSHATDFGMVTKVYIPPWFQVRIGLFIFAVWFFAAVTGICVTIVPLLLGRYMLTSAFDPKEFVNDIYAFSLGMYILGGVLYIGLHWRTIQNWISTTFTPTERGVRRLASSGWKATKRVASMLYVYSALTILVPLMNAILLEVYIIMPLHDFFHATGDHVMHLVQDWTLGILYVKIGMRIFLFDHNSRPARAIRSVFENGYTQPDANKATRYFILPTLLAFSLLIGLPFLGGAAVNFVCNRYGIGDEKVTVMRMAYPIALGALMVYLVGEQVGAAATTWRARIRDEVYLVGERLHNFGERKHRQAKGKARSEGTALTVGREAG